MVTVGNHEVDSSANPELGMAGGDSGGECGVATLKRFPYLGPSVEKMWCVPGSWRALAFTGWLA